MFVDVKLYLTFTCTFKFTHAVVYNTSKNPSVNYFKAFTKAWGFILIFLRFYCD